MPLRAVIVSDDDGRRPCPITPDEIVPWVAEANRIWAGAGVSFRFDPKVHASTLASTTINDLAGTGDANWQAARDLADREAANHPDELVVFFRFGPGNAATGGGFSWSDYNFIVAPGRVTSVCGHQNVGLLAHEIGHYLGLAHTFASVFGSLADAASALQAGGGDPAVFDGDGLDDTPPDPFIATAKYQCDPTTTKATLDGRDLPLPRENIMSYYEPRSGLSPMQIARARWFLVERRRNAMAMPDNHVAVMPQEADLLAVAEHRRVSVSPQDMDGFGRGWTGDRQLFCDFQPTGVLTLEFQAPATGDYEVLLFATRAPDFGRFRIYVDDAAVGVLEGWAPIVAPTGRVSLGRHRLPVGAHRITVEAAGMNPASIGTKLGLDCVQLSPIR